MDTVEKQTEVTKQKNIKFAEDQIKIYEQKKDLIQNAPILRLNAVVKTGKRLKVWETIYDDNFLMSDLVRAALIKDIDNMIAEYKVIIKNNADS